MAPDASLRSRVEALSWVHRIDLGGGLVTPGAWKRSRLVERAFDAIDFRQKRVLDVGCWDGLWSFEAEKRGAAEVVAVDDLSQRSLNDQPTFRLAHEALDSDVEYHPQVDVHDVAEHLRDRRFDIVLFLGVYYHLKSPLRALAQLRRVTRTGGMLVTEGPVIPRHGACYAEFLYDRVHKNDPSTWFLPTARCLREWIECSYFAVGDVIAPRGARFLRWPYAVKDTLRRLRGRVSVSTYRCVVLAQAEEREDRRYVFPDPDLEAFDRRDRGAAQPLSNG